LTAGKIRLATLDNTKPNAGRLLREVATLLSERGVVDHVVSVEKSSSGVSNPAGAPAAEETLARLVQEAGMVITGLAN